MNEQSKKPSGLHIAIAAAALILWGLSFVTDKFIFTSDALNMNCLPVDEGMIPFMHVLTKLLVLAFWLFIGSLVPAALKSKRRLIVFFFYLAVYVVGLLFTYPGYYMNDDPIIFGYATRYLPVYWHNYLTSLFYMTSMSLFPASCAPVLISDVFYALFFTYLHERGCALYEGKAASFLLLLPGLLPFTLLGALMCFRPAIYSSFFLFYFLLLYFDSKQRVTLTLKKGLLLSFMTALLSLWRSESIVLLPLSLFLIYFAYLKDEKDTMTDKAADTDTNKDTGKGKTGKWLWQLICFFGAVLLFYSLLSMPQKQGEEKYYGSDYLILSTTRPLSVIVWRPQTYEGADEDLEAISAVTEFGYLHNDSLSCSAYTRYNSDHNQGRFTQSGADRQTQKRYLKAAFNLITHNLDLYFGERLQLFLVTNGIYNYDKSLVYGLKPVVSTDFPLYDHDRAFGTEMLEAFKRFPISSGTSYALFLYSAGGEAFIPMLFFTFVFFIGAIIKKDPFIFFATGSLIAREAVIFLTAPASFIQYSYPTMFVTAAFVFLFLAGVSCQKAQDTEAEPS